MAPSIARLLTLRSSFGPSMALALRFVVGLAEDFWKDGDENPFGFLFSQRNGAGTQRRGKMAGAGAKESGQDVMHVRHTKANTTKMVWHAEAGEISEKMFGSGFVTPGGAFITEKLIRPIGLTKDMNVLDLSAGLGGRIRRIVDETGSYVTGLEPDAGVAKRGMELSVRAGKAKHASVEHYAADTLALSRMYDCVIARETFYRVANQPAFFTTIATHLKSRGHLAFTDYTVDPDHRDHPALTGWRQAEPLATPLGLAEMLAAWAEHGINLRIHEDLTDYYKKEVLKGLQNLGLFLSKNVEPDAETKQSIQKRLNIWAHRLAAMEHGLKFYRFYGTKA